MIYSINILVIVASVLLEQVDFGYAMACDDRDCFIEYGSLCQIPPYYTIASCVKTEETDEPVCMGHLIQYSGPSQCTNDGQCYMQCLNACGTNFNTYARCDGNTCTCSASRGGMSHNDLINYQSAGKKYPNKYRQTHTTHYNGHSEIWSNGPLAPPVGPLRPSSEESDLISTHNSGEKYSNEYMKKPTTHNNVHIGQWSNGPLPPPVGPPRSSSEESDLISTQSSGEKYSNEYIMKKPTTHNNFHSGEGINGPLPPPLGPPRYSSEESYASSDSAIDLPKSVWNAVRNRPSKSRF